MGFNRYEVLADGRDSKNVIGNFMKAPRKDRLDFAAMIVFPERKKILEFHILAPSRIGRFASPFDLRCWRVCGFRRKWAIATPIRDMACMP